MPSDPVDAAEVLTEAAYGDSWDFDTQPLAPEDALRYLSERAGGGGFAVLPDGEGGWRLYRVEMSQHFGVHVLVPIVEGDE